MKALATILFFIFSFSYSQAKQDPPPLLTATPVKDIINAATHVKYNYLGKIKLFGYKTTKSCIWNHKDFLIVKHYCQDDYQKPVRSFTIWSRHLGAFKFYEEDWVGLGSVREIAINEFPEFLANYLPGDLTKMTAENLNELMQTLYYDFNPTCWVGSYNPSTGEPYQGCYNVLIEDYAGWISQTQSIVNDAKLFDKYYQRILKVLP